MPRLYVAVAREIANYIQNTPLEPGARLPAERDLTKQFQVSRTTVREAMIALETMGIIEVLVGDGTYVRARIAPGSLPWERDGDPGPGPHEQFRMRMLVECAAAEDAARYIEEEELARLRDLIAAMDADVDGKGAELHRQAFHDVIAVASRNSIFVDTIRDLWRLRSGAMWRTVATRVVQPQHHILALADRKEILAALEKRDSAAAAAAMGRLLDRIRQRYFDNISE
ncbi:FadR/GntR family transcriptional regulator [Devosia sediminis]|uniref:FadR family transcriptional regulator n=1 Tax=Devosia sediminis TaxID=2798801 RepID=A0A934MHE1_9HYPH|nr:GntR family transcriptional regulator [Devosia sediminis]MBJ3784982.1 FadR family transcriptional regulator [Devosia sediminis]